jgi:hypothetical protein
MTTPAVRNLAGGRSLEPVLALSDPIGVLSIYVDAETRVDELEGELDALLDPPGSSSGRVLFPC